MRKSPLPTIIKVFVFMTVAPRWIPALMLADGYPMPKSWLPWWIPLSFAGNAGMALIEAVALAYISDQWHNASDKKTKNLLFGLIIVILAAFTVVLTPFVAASAAATTMQVILQNPIRYLATLVWSTAVVLSTGLLIIAVGVAQNTGKPIENKACWCGYSPVDEEDREAHEDSHLEEILTAESSESALKELERKYLPSRERVLKSFPRLVDVARMRNSKTEEKE